ncbi:DegV family protein [Vallitalea okinawensis]|uniref:DegV family protein n=1 Tax=Vallitalea okinawensis TaxID=2078660 RepID=UPI000CFE0D11|nr:DegV family protein [Vallitalea okinawensis]
MAYTIIVDSSCDLPKEVLEKYNMVMLPLGINFEDEVYADKVDITPTEFYDKLKVAKELPKTSQVTPDAFINAFKKELDRDHDVICITIGSQASGTFQSATIAKSELESDRIHLVDSEGLCMGTGMLAILIAEQLEAGKSIGEAIGYGENVRGSIEHLFSVDTLVYLKKGGRIKASSAVIGEILNIKPILTVDKGITQTIGKVRGRNKVMEFFMNHMKENIDLEATEFMAIAHACNEKVAKKLETRIRENFNFDGEIIFSEIGATIGTHAGPGTISVFYIKK